MSKSVIIKEIIDLHKAHNRLEAMLMQIASVIEELAGAAAESRNEQSPAIGFALGNEEEDDDDDEDEAVQPPPKPKRGRPKKVARSVLRMLRKFGN